MLCPQLYVALSATANSGSLGRSHGELTASHTYDNNGNTISDGIRTFEYNQSDRLVKVKLGVTVIAEYFYSGFSQRIKKVASGTTIHYHYDCKTT